MLTAAARAVVKEPLNVRSWIVCDGDVDPEWIESLNSVRAATPPSVMCMQTYVFEMKPSLRWLWGMVVDEVSLPLASHPFPVLRKVLDDNHLLTMPNGERISFGANVNFLFETHELR